MRQRVGWLEELEMGARSPEEHQAAIALEAL